MKKQAKSGEMMELGYRVKQTAIAFLWILWYNEEILFIH